MNKLEPTNAFSISRFFHLCKRSFVLNQRQWLMGLLASTGILLVIWVVPTLFFASETGEIRIENFHPATLFIFMLWGLLLTSDIFQELQTPSTAFQSLTLPATSTEKFLSAWFLTMPVFLLVTISAIFLMSLLSSFIIMMIEGTSIGFNIYNPFDETTGKYALNYLFLNSLFLLGAIYFRKNNFLKTIVAFIVLMISFLFIWTILGWLYMSFLGLDQFTFEFINSDPTSLFDELSRWVITSTALLLTYVLQKKQQVV